jgi:hypothetical protein
MVADNRAGDVIDFRVAQAFKDIAPFRERLAGGNGRRRGSTDYLDDELLRIAQFVTDHSLNGGAVKGCQFGDIADDGTHTRIVTGKRARTTISRIVE